MEAFKRSMALPSPSPAHPAQKIACALSYLFFRNKDFFLSLSYRDGFLNIPYSYSYCRQERREDTSFLNNKKKKKKEPQGPGGQTTTPIQGPGDQTTIPVQGIGGRSIRALEDNNPASTRTTYVRRIPESPPNICKSIHAETKGKRRFITPIRKERGPSPER
ncbi:hypothetical protein CEXT_161841 [Caerostris extrusa]|uniref:Uncharacterized protein n=1 Tax=Caerostris extrusa TaxID=172846 RepID=A0AAV4VVT1_CAEEX|nr:hypothetical protein CEXT_161841 [Caerostris extrusa]